VNANAGGEEEKKDGDGGGDVNNKRGEPWKLPY